MELIREILAKNLLVLRKELSITQAELAVRLETTTATYNRWENGTSWPDVESLEKIATLYGIRSTRLFYDHDLEKPLSDSWANRPSPKEIITQLQTVIDSLK